MEKTLLMNLTITLVVPCIILARKLFLYHVPGRIWLILWKILIFQLLCPFTFELPFISANTGKSTAEILHLQSQIQQSCREILFSSATDILKIIWFICGLIIAGIFTGTHFLNTRIYKAALPIESTYLAHWKKTHCLKRKIEIRESDRIEIPFTYGVLIPIILLPSRKNIDEKNLEAVLEHEFIHIKHFDVLLKWILIFLCSFYWYNPLIWMMYLFVNRDIELSCDEAVLKHHSSQYRKSYLLALLNLEEKNTKPNIFCSSFCKCPTKERIYVMLKREKNAPKNILLALFISSMVILLNVGITANAGITHSAPGDIPLFKYSTTGEIIPDIVGQNDEQAKQILQRYGLPFIIAKV